MGLVEGYFIINQI